MQAILLALMAITVLGIPISLSDPLVTLIVVVVLGLLAVAQRAQRRGAFRLGVRLAVGVMIVAIGLSMQAHSQQSCSGAHQTKFVAFHCAVSLATNPKLRLYGKLSLSSGATSTSDCLITGALDSADVGNGPTYGNLGNVYQDQGRYDEALSYYERSLEMAQRIGDTVTTARQLNNLGAISHLQGNFERAIDYYHQSLQIFRELGDHTAYANTLCELGNVYQMLKQYSEAGRLYKEALDLFDTEGHLRGQANILTQLAIVAQMQGRNEEARQYYQAALSRFQVLHDEDNIKKLLSLEDTTHDPVYHDVSGTLFKEVDKNVDQGIEHKRLIIRCYYCAKDTEIVVQINKMQKRSLEEFTAPVVVQCEHCKRPNIITLPDVWTTTRSLTL